jgi:hypothetical protein
MIKNYYKLLKTLAKSRKWQSIFGLSKETANLLFANNFNFSGLQLEFVDLLNYYSQIYMEVSMGEVTDKVLEDDIYIDSWFVYSREKRKRDKEQRQPSNTLNKKLKPKNLHTDSIVFTANRKNRQ